MAFAVVQQRILRSVKSELNGCHDHHECHYRIFRLTLKTHHRLSTNTNIAMSKCSTNSTDPRMPATDTPKEHSKIRRFLDRAFWQIHLLIPSMTWKQTKELKTKTTEHRAFPCSGHELQATGPANDEDPKANTMVDIIHNFKAPKFNETMLSAKSTKSQTPASCIENLPTSVLARILENLLVSDRPIALDANSQYPNNDCSHLHPQVLSSCRAFYLVGMPLLYGSNIITSSTSASSKDFDKHLLKLSGRCRQLIKRVRLQIDWADELWANFPLIARVLGEIVGLKSLEIMIFGQLQRRGPLVAMMLKMEEKCFADLVIEDLKALKEFKLQGFGNKAFAKTLESFVSSGRRGLGRLG